MQLANHLSPKTLVVRRFVSLFFHYWLCYNLLKIKVLLIVIKHIYRMRWIFWTRIRLHLFDLFVDVSHRLKLLSMRHQRLRFGQKLDLSGNTLWAIQQMETYNQIKSLLYAQTYEGCDECYRKRVPYMSCRWLNWTLIARHWTIHPGSTVAFLSWLALAYGWVSHLRIWADFR